MIQTLAETMASNASKGAAAKGRSKRWLEKRGYVVWDMEIVRTVYRDGRPAFTVKKDQQGADLGAMCASVPNLLVQCKAGKQAIGGTFPAARREFAKHPHPVGVRKVVMAWAPGARLPRIIEVFADGSFCEVQAV